MLSGAGAARHHGGMRMPLRDLARACHPMPSLAVTAFAGALAASAGVSAGRVAVLLVAVLSGQLSVGWLNDYVDRDIDRAAHRADKPLVRGDLDDRSVLLALTVAAAVSVVTSLALGWAPGLLHLVAVGSAYAYDVRLKWTVLSWLPFAVSFGLMPPVVTTLLPGRPLPHAALVLAGCALGVAAHLTNTVKDADADARTGVKGFPQRIGPRRALGLAAGLIAVAGVAVVVATPARWPVWVFGGSSLVAAVAAMLGGRRLAFPGTVAAAGLVVVGVVLSGGAVHR